MSRSRYRVNKRSMKGESIYVEMTLESLVASGLSQEQANDILAAHKAALAGNYVPKARFDEVSTSLKERDTQIAGLKKFEGTAQELQTKVTELEAANKQKDAEMQKALAAERKRNAMMRQLDGKVHDVDLVLGQIDVEKVSCGDDGTLTGFEDQIKGLKEKKGFLFVAETQNPQQQNSTQSGYRVVGKTPPEGADPTQSTDPAAEYGKQLAESKLQAQKQLQEGTNHYFKT